MSMNQSFVDQIQTPGALSPEELARVQSMFETALMETSPQDLLGRIVRTYAEALLAAADARGQADEVGRDYWQLVYEVFPSVPGLEAYLDSPAVTRKVKDQIILGLFDGKATQLFVDFLRILNQKDRLGYVRLIGLAYRTLRENRGNRQRILVESAAPLADDQKAALTAALAEATGKTPILVVRENPDLLGGLVVHVGDRVFDTSVRTRLTTLRNTLTARGSHAIQSRRDLVSHS
jgi:F-type H+-transporting ATPase subunit delta